MGRKKQDAPEVQEETVISADDAIREERDRITQEEISEFLGEDITKEDNKPPVVEPPKEEVKEEIVTPPPIDTEELKKEITEKVSKETVDKITQALTGKQEETTQEQKDKYLEYSEKFLAEKGRNPTWFELVPFIRDEVKQELKREQEETRVQQEEAQRTVAETEKQRTEAFNKHIDAQLEDLYRQERLPKIVNKDNPNDEGVQARKALFQAMLEVNQDRVNKGQDPIYSIKEIFYEHYKKPSRQPAGADAPVSVGSGNVAPESPDDYSYADIRNKSFLDFFRK